MAPTVFTQITTNMVTNKIYSTQIKYVTERDFYLDVFAGPGE